MNAVNRARFLPPLGFYQRGVTDTEILVNLALQPANFFNRSFCHDLKIGRALRKYALPKFGEGAIHPFQLLDGLIELG